jgi:hypothetical protein
MEWLWVDQVLGELGGFQDDRKERFKYKQYVESMAMGYVKNKELRDFEEAWKPIRTGWYLGGEGFRIWFLNRLDQVIEGKQRETYNGEAIREHDEAQAEHLFQRGLKTLMLEETDLKGMAKGAFEKQILAWWLRRKTVVSR